MNIFERKIGIMGGTFDPPHLGHLISAQISAEQLGLEKVIFIPTGNISYKDSSNTSHALDRYEMVRLAIGDNPLFDICDIEVREQDYSYTFSTLAKLKEQYPEAHLYFIVGADSLNYMDRWREPDKIFEQCSVIAVGRPGFTQAECKEKVKELKEKFDADIYLVTMPEIGISSTEIRKRLANGKSVRYMIPKSVEDYISAKNIYKKR